MTVQIQGLLMCAAVYAGIALVGIYFVVRDRRRARQARRGHSDDLVIVVSELDPERPVFVKVVNGRIMASDVGQSSR